MSRPTLYSFPGDYRAAKCLIAAQYANVDVVLPPFKLGKDNRTPEFLALFPCGKVPALHTAQGPISESGAIARYLARFNDQLLLGRTPLEASRIDQWVELAGAEIDVFTDALLAMVFGWTPANSSVFSRATKDLRTILKGLNQVLETETFLVGDRVTLADIAVGVPLAYLFRLVVDKTLRERAFPSVTRWLDTLLHQAQFLVVLGEVPYADKAPKAGQTQSYQDFTRAVIKSAKEFSGKLAAPVGKERYRLVISPQGVDTDMQAAVKNLRQINVAGADLLQHVVRDYLHGVQQVVLDVAANSKDALAAVRAAVLELKEYFQAVELVPVTD